MKKLHLPSTIPHCIWGIPTHTKGKPKMLRSSTLFAPNRQFFPDNFWEKKTKKKNTLSPKKQKKLFSCFPFFYCQKKHLMEILRDLDPKGKLSTYHSIFIQVGIIQSSPPSAPDNSILSRKSLWESLFFVGFNRFNPQRSSKFLGYLHHLPASTLNLSKIKIQILCTHPIGSKPKKNTRNRDVPAGPSVML